MKGILGRKAGMTEVFTKDGKVIPVTVIEVEPNIVMQVKTKDVCGYDAVQLGIVDKKEKNSTKASINHAKKAGTNPKRFLKEFRVENVENYALGDKITADIFEAGDMVDVTGTSKGKGFQGVIKRHGQSEGPKTHGSRYHRRPGSMGTMLPKRVLKGKRLAGHMGNETVTIQNLEIIEVNVSEGYILVSGNVPGPKKSLVLIKEAVKAKKVTPKEIVSYEEEVKEEVKPEVSNEDQSVKVETTEAVETKEVVEDAKEEKQEAEATKEEKTEEVKEETIDAPEAEEKPKEEKKEN